jgi:hypothetical protein
MSTATLTRLASCPLAFGANDDGRCEWCGRRISARRADLRFCTDACLRALDEAHRWPLARAAALRRSAGRCEVCGARPVEVHHVRPVGPDGYEDGCAHHAANLAVLCPVDHRLAHRNLRAKPGVQLLLFSAA